MGRIQEFLKNIKQDVSKLKQRGNNKSRQREEHSAERKGVG